jgi:hypothetical protein
MLFNILQGAGAPEDQYIMSPVFIGLQHTLHHFNLCQAKFNLLLAFIIVCSLLSNMNHLILWLDHLRSLSHPPAGGWCA